jgi:hypothetical protein
LEIACCLTVSKFDHNIKTGGREEKKFLEFSLIGIGINGE